MITCPYDECTFQGTQEEVDDHVAYLTSMDEPDHAPDKIRDGHRG